MTDKKTHTPFEGRTAGAQFDVPTVGEMQKLRHIRRMLDQLFLSSSKLNFASLHARGMRPLATDCLRNGDYFHRLIAHMRADGARNVYIILGDIDAPLTEDFTYLVPKEYDIKHYDGFFNSIQCAENWCLIDSEGRYCYAQVQSEYAFFVAPLAAFDSLMDDDEWLTYYHNFELLDSYGFKEGETSKYWQETVDAYFAVKAVQDYWRETGFTPPPRSELFKR